MGYMLNYDIFLGGKIHQLRFFSFTLTMSIRVNLTCSIHLFVTFLLYDYFFFKSRKEFFIIPEPKGKTKYCLIQIVQLFLIAFTLFDYMLLYYNTVH